VAELQPDDFWTSDDLSHQRSLFMRPDTFRGFLKPRYRRVGQVTRRHGLHWWLHSCGNNTLVANSSSTSAATGTRPGERLEPNSRVVGHFLTLCVVISVMVKRKNRYFVTLPLVSRTNMAFFISRSS